MKKRCAAMGSILFYLLSGVTFGFVLWKLPGLAPLAKAGLLLAGCLLFYLGSLLLGRTLAPPWPRRLIVLSLALFFVLYLLLLFSFTLFDLFFGRSAAQAVQWSGAAFSRYLRHSLNLLPFRTIGAYVCAIFTGAIAPRVILTNLLGNLCAFMPFAFFLPQLFPRLGRWRRFVPAMVLIVAAVELCQMLLLTGSCDIDDIILNAGGACLLFALLRTRPADRFLRKITLLPSPPGATPQDRRRICHR